MTRKRTKKENSKISVIERWDKPFEYFGFLNLVLMAFYYGSLWFSATPLDADKVFKFSLLMAFEFIMVHSGVFMVAFSARISLFIFFPVYGLFAYSFQSIMGFSDWTITTLYCVTVFNRMRFAFFNTSEAVQQRVMAQSVVAVMLYFFLAMFVAFGQNIVPEFALDEGFRKSQSYLDAKKHGGLFLDFPHTAIALGTLYFSFLALFDLSLIRKMK
ncbi:MULTISPECIES: hypothetical protein [Capnocytophaga]|uniref:Uncharacterized protein n=4 Tax=Capnocytophaga TaxID=1016 RepID=A0A0B7IFH1_9FLAO|nr:MULTISPECIES: hypothetical protein [Capnocytophaga]ATA73104.1 hypothetical protein CGC49_07350 [Capnocytophaga sp. H4358]ATA75194.1 hypothetical protein CGC52_07075 [Capnocytophaga sp. H2931]ATA90025.1 hypothetical protein CGC58_10010 [Capnocytophaga stomatis]RIY38354.1 hypothetical protein CKY20_02110 [Capnocytophaga canis]CEN43748.1 conserved membrane hypothetical protein [Capnocytophaga canis]